MISIYGLQDPITEQIKYIGASEYPEDRLYDHLSNKMDKAKYEWICSLRKKNLKPKLVILERCKLKVAKEREEFHISKLGIENLFNRKTKSNVRRLMKNRVVINLPDDIVNKLQKKIYKEGHRSASSYVRGLVYKDVL